MKRTLLDWNLGLGDALICNGMVRTLVAEGRQLVLPAHDHNIPSVHAMFEDIGKHVDIVPANAIERFEGGEIIRLGQKGDDFDEARWDESFYQQAEVPFVYKWEAFALPPAIEENMLSAEADKGLVVHDDPSRGFPSCFRQSKRKDYHFITEKKPTIFDYAGTIYNADEFHAINSCFAILADLIRAPSKLFMHHYARPTHLPIFGQHWEILK